MISLALAVPLTVVSISGLFLNIYIMFVVLVTKQIQTANNLLLLHLGAVNTLLCVTFLLFSAPQMLKVWPWLSLGAACDLHGFLFTLLHPVALWTVCGLNCDRYYAITSPLHYGSVVNSKKIVIGLASTWLVSFLLCIPPFFLVAPYKFNPELGGCAPNFADREGAIWYSLAYTTFTLFLPAILILGCNLRVLMIARYHRHRIASAIFEVTISAQVTITHQRNPFLLPSANIFRGRSAVSTVLQLVGSFIILYFPYYGLVLWESSSYLFIEEWKENSTRLHTILVTLACTLINCSPPVNGLLYGVKSKMLRKSFQNYWRKQMSKNEMNQEIQARTPSTCGSRRPSFTPLGFLTRPASSHLQRRSSEEYLERQSSSSKSSIQRMTGDLTWRPQSTTGINLDSTEPLCKSRFGTIPKHSSWNVLQVPKEKDPLPTTHGDNLLSNYKLFKVALGKKLSDSDGSPSPYQTPVPRSGGTKPSAGISNFTEGENWHTRPGSILASPKRSPKILISRAFSEESDPTTSVAGPRTEVMNRSYSSIPMDKKWKKLRYQDEEDLKINAEQVQEEELQSSASTSEEENGDGGVYMSFADESPMDPTSPEANPSSQNQINKEYKYNSKNGPFYLFSWPIRRKSNVSCGSSTVMLARSVTNLAGASEYQL